MSFKETYNTCYPELLRYGRQLQVAEADLEDLLQETFLRYHVELGKKVIIRNKRAWLYKVFHNLAMTRIQNRNRFKSPDFPQEMPAASTDAIKELEEKERRELVFTLLDKMPENEKNLLLLYHNGLKYKEIAEVLDLHSASVGTMLLRAIAKLKNILKTEYHELFR